MGFVYFTIPIIGGLYVMDWAKNKSEENIGAKGIKLKNGDLKQSQYVGDTKAQNKKFQAMLSHLEKQK